MTSTSDLSLINFYIQSLEGVISDENKFTYLSQKGLINI